MEHNNIDKLMNTTIVAHHSRARTLIKPLVTINKILLKMMKAWVLIRQFKYSPRHHSSSDNATHLLGSIAPSAFDSRPLLALEMADKNRWRKRMSSTRHGLLDEEETPRHTREQAE